MHFTSLLPVDGVRLPLLPRVKDALQAPLGLSPWSLDDSASVWPRVRRTINALSFQMNLRPAP
jgi:hypothetical protein